MPGNRTRAAPRRAFFGCLLAVALAGAAGAVVAQPVKVGVVNIFRLENESVNAKNALRALDAEMSPRAGEIKALQDEIGNGRKQLEADRGKLSREAYDARSRELNEKMRQSDRMVESLSETFEMRRREVREKLVQEARAAIKTVAESGQYDLVLISASYARSSVDITDLVLKEMERRTSER
jgi:outer membrane protein